MKLHALIDNQSSLDEAGFFKHLFARKQPAESDEDRTVADRNHDAGGSPSQQILDQIFELPSDVMRGVLLLNASDLKDRYLNAGGDTKIVSGLSDEEVLALFPNTKNSTKPVFKLVNTFNLGKLNMSAAKSRNYAVMLNVNKAAAAKFLSATPKSASEARMLLLTVIAHKYYVCTLNVGAIKKANVGTLEDSDERLKRFNIVDFITTYYMRATIEAARDEWSRKRNDVFNDVEDQDAESDNDEEEEEEEDDDNKPPSYQRGKNKDDDRLINEITEKARRLVLSAKKTRWPDNDADKKMLVLDVSKILFDRNRLKDREYLLKPIIDAFFNHPNIKNDKDILDLLDSLKSKAQP